MKAIALQKNISIEKITPWTDTDKAKLAVVLGRIFDVQKLYGKNVGQLGSMVELFSWVLAAYPAEKVINGIGAYLRAKSDLPTPADIKQIIDPEPPKWVPDKQLYYKLQQILKEQGPFGLDTEEVEYCKKYEDYMLRAAR